MQCAVWWAAPRKCAAVEKGWEALLYSHLNLFLPYLLHLFLHRFVYLNLFLHLILHLFHLLIYALLHLFLYSHLLLFLPYLLHLFFYLLHCLFLFVVLHLLYSILHLPPLIFLSLPTCTPHYSLFFTFTSSIFFYTCFPSLPQIPHPCVLPLLIRNYLLEQSGSQLFCSMDLIPYFPSERLRGKGIR